MLLQKAEGDKNDITTHGVFLDSSSPGPSKEVVHVGAARSAPEKTTWVIRRQQFKPGVMTEEEVIALVREVMGSCSNGKLQQRLWIQCLAAASRAQGLEQLLAGLLQELLVLHGHGDGAMAPYLVLQKLHLVHSSCCRNQM